MSPWIYTSRFFKGTKIWSRFRLTLPGGRPIITEFAFDKDAKIWFNSWEAITKFLTH